VIVGVVDCAGASPTGVVLVTMLRPMSSIAAPVPHAATANDASAARTASRVVRVVVMSCSLLVSGCVLEQARSSPSPWSVCGCGPSP
jgi:hypothetical protein